jgi:lambda family phage portal protein
VRFPRFRRRRAEAEDAPPARVDPPVTRTDVPKVRRSYMAARPDRLTRGFGHLFASSPRAELREEIRGLVQHARHAAHNFDLARSYEMLFRRHVVGPAGIRLQMDVRDAPDRPDQVANAIIERAWSRWCRAENCTISGALSWWGVECQVATAIAREGGAFVRLHRRGRFALQVEPLPFDLLAIDQTAPLRGGGYVEGGIEFDDDGRPVAFRFWRRHPAETHFVDRREVRRVPAAEVVHVWVPEEIGQALGVPRSATALRLMNMINRYQESAMVAANYGAAAMIFFSQRQESDGQLTGVDDVHADVPIDEIEAGTMAMLPPGVEPHPHTPHYPDAAIEPFVRHMSTTTAAGLGVSAETLTGDLSRANFSSLRAGKAEERDEWRMLQRAIYEGLHDRVFREWLPAAMVAGEVPLPMAKLDKFLAPVWRPRGWPSVNPKDDATANEVEVRLGLRSRTEIVAERGRDFADVCAERQLEEADMRAKGLDPSLGDTPAATPPGDQQEGD